MRDPAYFPSTHSESLCLERLSNPEDLQLASTRSTGVGFPDSALGVC